MTKGSVWSSTINSFSGKEKKVSVAPDGFTATPQQWVCATAWNATDPHFTINITWNIYTSSVPHPLTWFIPGLFLLFLRKQHREAFKQRLLQLCVNVWLSSQRAPQQEAGEHQADGEDLPPGPLELTAHAAVHFPGSVTGFTGGELDGFTFHLFVPIFGFSWPLRAQGEGPHTVQPAEKEEQNLLRLKVTFHLYWSALLKNNYDVFLLHFSIWILESWQILHTKRFIKYYASFW